MAYQLSCWLLIICVGDSSPIPITPTGSWDILPMRPCHSRGSVNRQQPHPNPSYCVVRHLADVTVSEPLISEQTAASSKSILLGCETSCLGDRVRAMHQWTDSSTILIHPTGKWDILLRRLSQSNASVNRQQRHPSPSYWVVRHLAEVTEPEICISITILTLIRSKTIE